MKRKAIAGALMLFSFTGVVSHGDFRSFNRNMAEMTDGACGQ
jgi:hypothetical protein